MRWSIFVDAGVPVTVILLTLGEFGIPQGSPVLPDSMREVRRAEFTQAATDFGFTPVAYDFGDLALSFTPGETLATAVLKEVREKKFGVLFSIHPDEVTAGFDHPDHNAAGTAARFAGAAADVAHFHPELPAMAWRPNLFLWTTDRTKATHSLPLPEGVRERRNRYLTDHYPSQRFLESTRDGWVPIFDRITRDKEGHTESYRMIR